MPGADGPSRLRAPPARHERRLTRAANIRWLVEHGDEGAGVSEREVGRSELEGLQLRAYLECGDSEVLGA